MTQGETVRVTFGVAFAKGIAVVYFETSLCPNRDAAALRKTLAWGTTVSQCTLFEQFDHAQRKSAHCVSAEGAVPKVLVEVDEQELVALVGEVHVGIVCAWGRVLCEM